MFACLPVLMYHSISAFPHKLCVAPERFEQQCESLTKAGWKGISLAEAEGYLLHKRRLPKKTCLFTFDDGYLDNYVQAEPILRQHGHYGVLFPVTSLIEERRGLRPTRDDVAQNPALASQLPDLDTRQGSTRARLAVHSMVFCSWEEVAHMHHKGHLSAAPHSMGHDRVVTSLAFKRLYLPSAQRPFFSTPPFDVPWGLPRFPLGRSLADRAYRLNPKLFDLVRGMVPQEQDEALLFFATPQNRQAVLQAIAKLPSLGTLETEKEYRERVFKDFSQCREVFTQKLGTPPISFCWPWGAYSPIALQEGQRAGFTIFFTTRRGGNFPGNALAVRRISVSPNHVNKLPLRLEWASNPVREVPYGLYRDWLKSRLAKALYWKCRLYKAAQAR